MSDQQNPEDIRFPDLIVTIVTIIMSGKFLFNFLIRKTGEERLVHKDTVLVTTCTE